MFFKWSMMYIFETFVLKHAQGHYRQSVYYQNKYNDGYIKFSTSLLCPELPVNSLKKLFYPAPFIFTSPIEK